MHRRLLLYANKVTKINIERNLTITVKKYVNPLRALGQIRWQPLVYKCYSLEHNCIERSYVVPTHNATVRLNRKLEA